MANNNDKRWRMANATAARGRRALRSSKRRGGQSGAGARHLPLGSENLISSHLWGLCWLRTAWASGPFAASASPLHAPDEDAARLFAAHLRATPGQRVRVQRHADALWRQAMAAFEAAVRLRTRPGDPTFIRAAVLADKRGRAAAKALRVVWLMSDEQGGDK